MRESFVTPSTSSATSSPNSAAISSSVVVGVLDDVVQQRRDDHRRLCAQLGADLRDARAGARRTARPTCAAGRRGARRRTRQARSIAPVSASSPAADRIATSSSTRGRSCSSYLHAGCVPESTSDLRHWYRPRGCRDFTRRRPGARGARPAARRATRARVRAGPRAGRRPARPRGRSCRRRRAVAGRASLSSTTPLSASAATRGVDEVGGRRRRRGQAARARSSSSGVAASCAAARQSTAMTARSASASTQARANTASDSCAAICDAPAGRARARRAPRGAPADRARARAPQRSRSAASRAKLWWSATATTPSPKPSQRLLQHRRVAAARADEQRARAVAARIGQRRQAPLDVGHEHDDGPAAARERGQRGLAAAGALGQRDGHGLAGRRPAGQAAPSRAAGAGSTRLALGPRHDVAQHEPRRERAAPVVDLEPADDVVARADVQRLGLAAAPPGDRAAVRRGVGDLQPQVLAALPHALHAHQLRAGHEQVDAGIAVAAAARSARARARARARPRRRATTASTTGAAHAGVLGQVLGRVRAQGGGERLDRGRRRCVSPAAARWPPKRSRCAAAGREARVQVVGRDRAAAALAALAVERDQDDGPRVALDEARGDDADHALVPALARRRRARGRRARARRCARSRRPRRAGSCPRPPGARGCAPRAARPAAAASAREGASRRSSASSGSPRRPAALMRGARRKLRSDARTRAGSTPALDISARRPGRSASARRRRPRRTSARFSSRSGTTSATVASATRSESWSSAGGSAAGSPPCRRDQSACASLSTTPVPHRSANG